LQPNEIPPGTLYLLILKTLARSGEMHGYQIVNSVQRISDDVLQVEEGSLYPALQRMLIKGWVIAKWGVTAGNRRALLPVNSCRPQESRRGNIAVRARSRCHNPRDRGGLKGGRR
jgi:PadR family transcriptional regulator